MSSVDDVSPLGAIPEAHRPGATAVLQSVVDLDAIESLEPVAGGASGALVYRLRIGGRSSLLRIETARDVFRDPHRTYPCMHLAADAGIAPPLLAADPVAGVVLMEFIEQRPLHEHPGGTAGVARDVGDLIARLQRTPPAPPLLDFPILLDHMFTHIESSELFAAGVLDPIRTGLVDVSAAYPWDRSPMVTSHNDVNPFNLLFDGRRLWLVDWELAFRNDPLFDVAGASNNLTESPRDVDALLRAWAGVGPDAATHGRLTLMRALNQLYYACLMLSLCVGRVAVMPSLDPPSPDEFRAAVAAGRLHPGSLEALHGLGIMQLGAFAAAATSPDTARAAQAAAAG